MRTPLMLLLLSLPLTGCLTQSNSSPVAGSTNAVATTTTTTTTTMPDNRQEYEVTNLVVSQSPDRNDYPASRTVDNDNGTFMTTNTLGTGDVVVAAYSLPNAVDLSYIYLYNNYSNTYALGNLTILTSTDSTNGSDGNWETAATIDPASHGFTDGDKKITLTQTDVKWIKLRMQYQGSGAYGGSPSFYLSEIRVYELR